MNKHVLDISQTIDLEFGEKLENISITYHTSGKLYDKKDNVIWVFHALTADSNCENWWNGLVGDNRLFNSKEHFIVCANILGSCYGTTGPTSLDFPSISIRDMVTCHKLLADHLGINKIKVGLGGSMGGYQALEWAYQSPDLFDNLVLIATSARESEWGIAIHEAHRQALKADVTFGKGGQDSGRNGLKAARSFGMIQYRSYESYKELQAEEDINKKVDYKAASYIEYQGEKFINRFSPYSYYTLLNAMDTHNLARNRHSNLNEALAQITGNVLVIGISSDYLCPTNEQKTIAEHVRNGIYKEISSIYGHDGFLVEFESITRVIKEEIKLN